jgi:hypothetical protein
MAEEVRAISPTSNRQRVFGDFKSVSPVYDSIQILPYGITVVAVVCQLVNSPFGIL